MRRFYNGVVKHKKSIIVIFLCFAAVCGILQSMVKVNYDMNDYLPEDTASTVSLDVMQEEFDSGIPNARVMIRNVTIPEALEYKEKIEAVNGVTDVMWLDDSVNMNVPLETLDQDLVENYYKDETALMTVTIEENLRLSAVSDIREIIGDKNAMAGSAVSTAVATTSTVSEIQKIASFAVLFVLIVLLLTMNSWLEPFIVLGGLGIAILINSGTNLIFGEISFVTNAAGSILQLAVSLDYSVFLMHRFEECRREKRDVNEAMVDALCKSTGSILSSGLTTVIGFAALVLMKFQLGPDLGLALAKGVAISLITVFIFMPSFILVTYKWLDRTRHRSFVPSFRGFGKIVCRLMFPMVILFAVIVVPSYLASNANVYYYGSSHMFSEETQLGRDTRDIEDVFGKSDTCVLLVPKGDTGREAALSEELKTIPQVSDIISFVDVAGAEIPPEYVEEDTLSQIMSDNYSRMVINAEIDMEGEETFAVVEQLRSIAEKYYPGTYYMAGESVSTYDLMNTVKADMVKVNLVAIAAVFLVLLILTKSLILPLILVLSIETAIWVNLSVSYFMGSHVFYIAYLIISSVQLGATVDYAILFSDRYREYRANKNKKTAVIETIASVTVSIMTSGSVLSVVGFLLGKFSSNGLLSQLGYYLGVGAICSLMIVFFVLPGLLYIFDRLFMKEAEKR